VADALRRIAPALRQMGIEVTFDRLAPHTRRRLIAVRKIGQDSIPSIPDANSPSSGVRDRGSKGSDGIKGQDVPSKSSFIPRFSLYFRPWDRRDRCFPGCEACSIKPVL
jgi:hypothetical protein